MTARRPRGAVVAPFPVDRLLVTAAMRAGRGIAPMHGLVDIDVTEATRLITDDKADLSLTAFVVASVARAAAAHPLVHGYRNWRGQLVTHRHVDVTTIVEVPTPQGPFPLAHVVRDADVRSVADLTGELRGVKREPSTSWSARWLETLAPVAARIPGLVPAMYRVMATSVRARQRTGTVAVTAVGMFGAGGGFAIAPLTLMTLQVVVGGITPRPRVIAGAVEVRDVLDLTVSIDHNIVDGAPAARFAADLRRLLEHATALEPTS